MKTYRKTSDRFSFSATHSRTVEEYSGDEPEPTPRRVALSVVPTTGITVSESTRPLARCRQISPVVPFIRGLKRFA